MLLSRNAFALSAAFLLASWPAFAGERTRWNADWRFALSATEDAPAAPTDAAAWRAVHLPHDWSIELGVDRDAASGGNGGFFETGLGWYRKSFRAAAAWRGRQVSLLFEGVHRDARVSINGREVARSVYGYTPFEADLTPHLHWDGENEIVVRVDNSAQPNSRWYTGSGIYRPVWLHVRASTHVATDGVFVSTESLTESSAEIRVQTEVSGPRPHGSPAREGGDRLVVETRIMDPAGREVARSTAPADAVVESRISIPNPRPWSPDSPSLYRVATRLLRGTVEVDRVATSFGIRTIRVSAERGFELNGQPMKLNGGNVHHDNGVLGAAAFDRAEQRKAELMKQAGFNAVRTAHNPPSSAFLEACDRLGLLVVNEIFDGWAKAKTKHDYAVFFDEWWRRDVDAWVRRDRNHASVVLWSIGNEMFERGNARGREIARNLAQRIREFDATRPITAGVNGMGKSGDWTQLDPLFAALDVAGYNYELARHAADHARLPERVILAAESYQNEIFANWRVVQEHAYVIGDFVWSSLDYLGEAGIGRVFGPDQPVVKHWEGSMWPWHGAYCGDIDLTGWRKPVSHYRNIVWDAGEKIHIAVVAPAPGGREWNLSPWAIEPALSTWTWPEHGQAMTVDVFSRCEAVRLLLNDRLLGEKPTGRAEEFRARFEVPFERGRLEAVGLAGGREVARQELVTGDAPARFQVDIDRRSLTANGEDLAFITIEAVDAQGNWNPNSVPPRVTIEIDGAATLAGFGTGDMTSTESYQSKTRHLFQGRALLVVRAGTTPGAITVRIASDGMEPATLRLEAVAAPHPAFSPSTSMGPGRPRPGF